MKLWKETKSNRSERVHGEPELEKQIKVEDARKALDALVQARIGKFCDFSPDEIDRPRCCFDASWNKTLCHHIQSRKARLAHPPAQRDKNEQNTFVRQIEFLEMSNRSM